ncbi:MAG TPA: glucuronate isomerase [Gemmatimonadaceae bacterium]|jgi:glucuronate isomerase
MTRGIHHSLVLDDNRFFDPGLTVRAVARSLYEATRDLPLICPHGHVDPSLLATNDPFPEPSALLLLPDHYILRMLYSRGVPLESLGVPARDGTVVEADPRAIWQIFAEHYYLFRGTPTGVWFDHELYELFGVRLKLNAGSAQYIYGQINERLASPEFRPRALFDRFNIEVLATTDNAADPLAQHRAIRDSGWPGNVVPTFRPDALFRIAGVHWRTELAGLSAIGAHTISDFASFCDALSERRAFFKTLGATATDHGVVEPFTTQLATHDADAIFKRALDGNATLDDQYQFEAHMLVEMARMSIDDGLVMQLHAGVLRDHNPAVARRFGADRGADIPVRTEYTRNLKALLDAHGNDPRLTLILFTLDESTYARELAPLAGHYPALRLGPPWWFHDSIEGMTRYRQQVTETAGIYNTAGFNDDTRAFCSIPARHDLSRRLDANYLAGLVARHIIDVDDARTMARALAYDLARETYRFPIRTGELTSIPS